MSMLPFTPSQKAVCQHHNDDVAMEACPLPSLVVTQSQLILGILVEPIYVPTPMGIVHEFLQWGVSREVREIVFPLPLLSISWSLTNKPSQCLTFSIHSAICTNCHKLPAQPSLPEFDS
jgi:hypothetical protein